MYFCVNEPVTIFTSSVSVGRRLLRIRTKPPNGMPPAPLCPASLHPNQDRKRYGKVLTHESHYNENLRLGEENNAPPPPPILPSSLHSLFSPRRISLLRASRSRDYLDPTHNAKHGSHACKGPETPTLPPFLRPPPITTCDSSPPMTST